MISFKKTFDRKATYTLKVPLRIAPFGPYLDCYNKSVTGLAVDKYVTMSLAFNDNPTIRLYSAEERKTAVWETNDATKTNTWVDYCKGATEVVKREFGLESMLGFDCYVDSDLPSGLGLASSAAVSIGYVCACLLANGLKLRNGKDDLLRLAMKVETDYVGVKCGKMDFAGELFGKEKRLMVYSCETDKRMYSGRRDFRFAFIYSPIRHSLVDSDFNKSVDDADCTKFMYVNSEDMRVTTSETLWSVGDAERIGNDMSLSATLFAECWGVTSDTTKALCRQVQRVQGVYGARYSGSGIGGGIIALVSLAGLRRLKREFRGTNVKVIELRSVDGFDCQSIIQ